jgi:hypothetical protein
MPRSKYVWLVIAWVGLAAILNLLFEPGERTVYPLSRLSEDIRFQFVERIEEGDPDSKVHLLDGSSYAVEESDIEGALEGTGVGQLPPIEERTENYLLQFATIAGALFPFFLIVGLFMFFFDWLKRRRLARPPARA